MVRGFGLWTAVWLFAGCSGPYGVNGLSQRTKVLTLAPAVRIAERKTINSRGCEYDMYRQSSSDRVLALTICRFLLKSFPVFYALI
jgi:hypothetical protein